MSRTIALGFTGASGMPYGVRLLDRLVARYYEEKAG